MMEEDRTSILILILSLALAMALYFYFTKYVTPPKTSNKSVVTKKVKESPLKKKLVFKGENIKIETKHYTAVINTQGGVITSFTLKEYKDDKGKPMELIPPEGFFLNTDEKLNSIIFTVKKQNLPDRIVLTLNAPTQKEPISKVYTFYKNEWRFEISSSSGVYFGPRVAPNDRKSKYSFVGPLIFDGKKAKEIKLKKSPSAEFSQPVWIALQSLYFTVTLIPKEPVDVKIKKEGKKNYWVYVYPKKKLLLSLAFAGPKKYDLLKSYGLHLEENIRFGIFGFISKPLLVVMNFMYKYVHNYGIAIIILTILIKIIFHPLTVKGYKSMNKLKEIQPLIEQLKEAYKDDPNKLNQELMALYKKYKVNPFGGCLPLLLQIPVFFALYKLLMVSIELRHAPFMLWITDLSAKDPYYITPVLMGVTMFIQQLLTPTTQDPMQSKFMLVLPVVFTLIFLNFPSGLVLYFLVNNIISIGEQLMIKHIYK